MPFPESSFNEEAGRLFQENYQEYFKLARLYTNIHSASMVSESSIKMNTLLNENNNRTNIRNNDYSKKDLDITTTILSKNVNCDIIFDNELLDVKKHSRSLHFTDTNAIIYREKDEKINLNSFNFHRANSFKSESSNQNSKSKQDEEWKLE